MEYLRKRRGRQLKTTVYDTFKGVDFSKNELTCDKNHSPDAVNMISDEGGFPVKRPGFKAVQHYPARINGIYKHPDCDQLLVHAGDKLYLNGEVVLSEMPDERSCSFYLNGKLYVLGGDRGFEFYVNEEKQPMWDLISARIPLIAVGRDPSGGGGTIISNLNLLTNRWKESFRAENGEKAFKLLYGNLALNAVKVWVRSSEGILSELTEGTHFTVDRKLGKVTLKTPAPKPSDPGEDNVTIEAQLGEEAKEGELKRKEKITRSKSCAIYNNTIFVAGSVKGMDFRSGVGDPTYFPDTGYDEVGIDSTDIMGYINIGNRLAIVKEQNGQDPTIFLRHDEILNDETVYVKEPCISGVGAASRHCFGSLMGDPLFLSPDGVVAITSNMVTSERVCQNRSHYVDVKLLADKKSLADADAIEFRGRYYICINGKMYILDGLQDKKYERMTGGFIYECFYWEFSKQKPRCLFSDGEDLYFGSESGDILKMFKENGPYDSKNWLDDGEIFTARWSTCLDDDGDYSMRKTVPDNNISVTLKPFAKSDVRIILKANNKTAAQEFQIKRGTFSFSDITFSEISFSSLAEMSIPVNKSPDVKRYNALKITVESNSNKPFGVFNIIKRWFFLDH